MRKTRTITYDNPTAAKIFLSGFSMGNRAKRPSLARISASNAHALRVMGRSRFFDEGNDRGSREFVLHV